NSGSSLTFPTDSASAAVSPSSVPATHTFASGTAARTVPRILEITVCPPRLTPGLWTPPNRRERPPLRIITVIDMVRSYAFLPTLPSSKTYGTVVQEGGRCHSLKCLDHRPARPGHQHR